MKIILSRKGFDSSSGGYPSPILPDGSFLSLPIPSDEYITYRDLTRRGYNYGEIVTDLTCNKIKPTDGLHLDPDLDFHTLNREVGWRPIFGQVGVAQGHLDKQNVEEGDVFLFFGWFKKTEFVQGHLRYTKNAPDIQAIFGWLQIDKRLSTKYDCVPEWTRYHSHVYYDRHTDNDSIYIAKEYLNDDPSLGKSGGGIFQSYSENLQLTASGFNKSIWQLPSWFYPEHGKPPMTYHKSTKRWKKVGEKLFLQTVGRGQEFVLDTAYYPEAVPWIREILKNH